MRYYFNVRVSDSMILDEEGEDLPDAKSLYRYALQLLNEIEREFPRRHIGTASAAPLAVEIVDEEGLAVFCLPVHQRYGHN